MLNLLQHPTCQAAMLSTRIPILWGAETSSA